MLSVQTQMPDSRQVLFMTNILTAATQALFLKKRKLDKMSFLAALCFECFSDIKRLLPPIGFKSAHEAILFVYKYLKNAVNDTLTGS